MKETWSPLVPPLVGHRKTWRLSVAASNGHISPEKQHQTVKYLCVSLELIDLYICITIIETEQNHYCNYEIIFTQL